MIKYFKDNRLPLKKTGMLVVATNKKEYEQLKKYYSDGIKNNINLKFISVEEAKVLEPTIRSNKEFKVIYSP